MSEPLIYLIFRIPKIQITNNSQLNLWFRELTSCSENRSNKPGNVYHIGVKDDFMQVKSGKG